MDEATTVLEFEEETKNYAKYEADEANGVVADFTSVYVPQEQFDDPPQTLALSIES
jgi:hypothetical protein